MSPRHTNIFDSNFNVWGHWISQWILQVDSARIFSEVPGNIIYNCSLGEVTRSSHSLKPHRLVISHLPVNFSLSLGFIGQAECQPTTQVSQESCEKYRREKAIHSVKANHNHPQKDPIFVSAWLHYISWSCFSYLMSQHNTGMFP